MGENSLDLSRHKIFDPNQAADGLAVPPAAPDGLPKEAQDLFRLIKGGHSMAAWIYTYVKEEVAGIQAPNTLRAKLGDLAAFVQWMLDNHGRAEMQDWLPRNTQQYLRTLERRGRKPTTINRVYASIRRFVRWAHERPGGIFSRHGLPTRGIMGLAVEEPDCKKLSAQDVNRLLRAADRLVDIAGGHRRRARRNRAILLMFLHTGLRRGELIALQKDQWRGKHLHDVARKGRARTKSIYLTAECRSAIDDYFEHERPLDDLHQDEKFLFLSGYGTGRMNPDGITKLLQEIAREASRNLPEPIHLHAHRLRHTFGALYRERTGSDAETAAALGHTGMAHVKRYIRRTDEERAQDLEDIFQSN